MKFVVFFSLWALASSIPLREGIYEPTNWWGLQGTGQETNQLWQQENVLPIFGQQNSVEQQIAEVLRGGQVKNVLQGLTPLQPGTQRTIAQQIVQLIVQQSQQKKEILIQQVIEQLEQQLQQQGRWNVVGLQSVAKEIRQVEIVEAIKLLQQIQRLVVVQVLENQLTQTLEVAVEAELISQTIDNQVGQFAQTTRTPVKITEEFKNRVQKLVDQITIQEIQGEISRQERIVQQLQQQQQFVNKQKQQTQVQKLIAQQQTQSQQPSRFQQLQSVVPQLEVTKQTLEQQEQQLLQQQLSRQVVIQQLQKVLIVEQDQLQQDTLSQQINEVIPQVGNQLYQFQSQIGQSQVGNRMWTQVPQTQATSWLTKVPTFTTRGLQLETSRPVYGEKMMW